MSEQPNITATETELRFRLKLSEAEVARLRSLLIYHMGVMQGCASGLSKDIPFTYPEMTACRHCRSSGFLECGETCFRCGGTGKVKV